MLKKVILPLAFAIVLVSCGAPEKKENTTVEEPKIETVKEELVLEEAPVAEVSAEAGSELFTTSGCVACHQLEAKTVGPALKEIAAGYAEDAAGLTAFLNGESDPIIDVAQAAVMAPQVNITKAMSESDRNSIVAYIMSNK